MQISSTTENKNLKLLQRIKQVAFNCNSQPNFNLEKVTCIIEDFELSIAPKFQPLFLRTDYTVAH